MAKSRPVPAVLWKLFHNRARTLADAILSLIPPPTSSIFDCRCKGRRCLGCCAQADRMSFLVRHTDSSEYKNFLTRCYVVVADNAPPVSVYHPNRRWSQVEIVRRTVEMILFEQPKSSNLICSGYDKHNGSSDILELLTCSVWCLLLERVGDALMVYLFKYTSIFLPLPRGKHHQVSGFPISNLCYNFSKHMSESTCPDHSSDLGSKKIQKGFSITNAASLRQQSSGSFSADILSSSEGCLGCKDRSNSTNLCMNQRFEKKENNVDADRTGAEVAKGITGRVCEESSRQALPKSRKRSRYFSERHKRKRRVLSSHQTCCLTSSPSNFRNRMYCSQKKLPVDDTGSSGATNSADEGLLTGVCHDSSRQDLRKSRKRPRFFSRQRDSKRRLGSSQELSCAPCPTNVSNKDTLAGRRVYNNNKNSILRHGKCSCCNLLQTLQKGSRDLQIDRQSIFYKFDHSKLVLPRSHIINSLKPNIAGATALFKDIFGADVNISSHPIPCFHRDNQCLMESTCLYHSFIRLLKILLHKARGCQHLILLDKHCNVPCLDQISNGIGISMSEENEYQLNSCMRRCVGLKGENQQQLEKCRSLDQKIYESVSIPAASEPIKLYCPKAKVVSFIWAVCRNIVPPDLLGTSHNWRTLRRNISKFISLRRYEKFSLKQCIHKLKKSKFPFISKKHSLCCFSNHVLGDSKGLIVNAKEELSGCKNDTDIVKQKLLSSWMYWFFSRLVGPLLQANFYVTEREGGKQEVFYYQKSVWEKLMTRAISSLKDHNYHLLNVTCVRNILTNRTFGFSKVRLLPKGNGIRPLANLGAPSRIPVGKSWTLQGGVMRKSASLRPKKIQYENFKSVNSVLRSLHVILKDVQLRRPEILGSSVFDYSDVYRKLRPFLSDLKNGLSAESGLYMVVADVSKAFDSVNQDKLLSVMKNVILNDDYLLEKSQQVVSTKKNLKVSHNLIMANEDGGSFSSRHTSALLARSSHSIFVNREWSKTVAKEDLHLNLLQHVKRNLLQVDKRFYLQNVGIPQGSILSPLLCSLYYGHLENTIIFPFLEKFSEHGKEGLGGELDDGAGSASLKSREDKIYSSPEYILLRLVDDFLFISTSKKQAAAFFLRLQRGFREYNCYMNESKFGANFDLYQMPGFRSSRIYLGEDGISFMRWSGLFINCHTFEVQADYTRYVDTHMSSTLTVCRNSKPGCHLKRKLCNYLLTKCHHIFYDSNINSPMVVRLNIYQAFLICAMKFHCYIHDISDIYNFNSKMYMNSIELSLRYMKKLIKRRMNPTNVDQKYRPSFQIGKGEVEWLGLNAYIRVLERKQSRHKKLLHLLKLKLMENDTETVSSVLKDAIDDSHSSIIWKIKY